MAILVLAPLAIAVSFSLAGHPLLQGDNLIQNFPLRVEAGRQIASGILPAWDPWIWSGTPLLAGWNAGALYPGTFLFAFLPGVAAWTINVASVGIVAGTGTYCLARMLGCEPLASFLGAVAFSYTGFMSGQVVHIGLVEGTALMPWLLVGIEALFRARSRRARIAPVLLVGLSSSCTVLSGDPRAVTGSAIAAGIYALAVLLRPGSHRLATFVWPLAGGIALGAAISAVQWLPGLSYLHTSSRQSAAYATFVYGSLSFPHIAVQLALPFLMGTSATFSTPVYQGLLNLPEVTIGCGFLALAAAFAYLPELVGQMRSFLRERIHEHADKHAHEHAHEHRGGKGRRLGTWYVLLLVGVVLTAGSHTPLASVLVHVPLFGGERLQNRNAALIDLALCVLLAFFVEDLVGSAAPIGRPLGTSTRRMLGAIPALMSVGLVAYGWASPLHLEARIGLLVRTPGFFDALDPYLVPAVVTASGVAGFVLFGHLLARRLQRFALVVLAVADLGVFLAFNDYATAPVSSFGSASSPARTIAALDGASGRQALFDPSFFVPRASPQVPDELGLTDLNILQDNPSVAGYGSAVNSVYQSVTGTHELEYLDPRSLTGSAFDSLDLRTLLAPPISFGEDIPPSSPIPVAGGQSVTETGRPAPVSITPGPPPYASGPWTVPPGGTAAFVLARPHRVIRVTVVVNPVLPVEPSTLEIALDDATSAHHDKTTASVAASVVNGVALVTFPRQPADTVLVKNPSHHSVVIGAVVAVTHDPDTREVLDGALQGSLRPPHWVFATRLDGFSVYSNTRTKGFAWLQASTSSTANPHDSVPGTLEMLTPASSTSPSFLVKSPGSDRLVWSEGYSTGWKARVRSLATGTTRTVAAKRLGLVLSVELPAGRYRVTFVYEPSSLKAGLDASEAGVIVLLLLVIVPGCWPLLLARRRSRVGGDIDIAT